LAILYENGKGFEKNLKNKIGSKIYEVSDRLIGSYA
jgi:hypothetical protein